MTDTPTHATTNPRRLRFDDLEFRAQTLARNNESALWIPYIKMACASAIMDEWCGPANWRNTYDLVTISGAECMVATIEVTFDGGETWVGKSNVGVASNMESQKGMFSDSLKRCLSLMWGVGRDVYSLGGVWAPAKVIERNGKKPLIYMTDNGSTLREIERQMRADFPWIEGEATAASVVAEPEGASSEDEPDWSALGWTSQGEHDDIRDRLVTRTGDAEASEKGKVKDLLAKQGITSGFDRAVIPKKVADTWDGLLPSPNGKVAA